MNRIWHLTLLAFVFVVGCSYTQTGTGQTTGNSQPAAVQQPQATTLMTSVTSLGTILVDSQGMTLYTFRNDKPGVSNCEGACATLWPPLTVTGTPTASQGINGTLGTITRSDGSSQVTYNGLPLYTYSPDTSPGDTLGQGYKNLWYVVTV